MKFFRNLPSDFIIQWFKTNTSGTCTIDGNEVSTNDEGTKVENNKTEFNVVGDNKYGYITIPKNWAKFYDVDMNYITGVSTVHNKFPTE